MRILTAFVLIWSCWAVPTSWAATIAQDSFTEASDAFLENHTPETGGGWAVTATGVFDIIAVDDNLRIDNPSQRGAKITDVHTDDDFDISVDVTILGSAAGDNVELLGRIQSSILGNRYSLFLEGDSQFKMVKRVGGSSTDLGEVTVSANDGDIEFSIDTAEKIGCFDDVEQINSNDNNLTGENEYGLAIDDRDNHADNYLVVDVEDGCAGVAVAFTPKAIFMKAWPEWLNQLFGPFDPVVYAQGFRPTAFGHISKSRNQPPPISGHQIRYYRSLVCGIGSENDSRRPCGIENIFTSREVDVGWILLYNDVTEMVYKVSGRPQDHVRIPQNRRVDFDNLMQTHQGFRDYINMRGEGMVGRH